jgi:acetyl esterase/lipase
MRAMSLMYLAGSPIKPDVYTDYYLSAINAPDSMLARFPKTYFLVGEKDPLVDDSLVFAARIREAKKLAKAEWLRVRERHVFSDHLTVGESHSDNDPEEDFENHIFAKNPDEMIKLKILPGMSHAFFQMHAFLPEATELTLLTSDWLKEMFLQDGLEGEPSALTSLMITEMDEIAANSVYLRRRDSMASKIGLGRT